MLGVSRQIGFSVKRTPEHMACQFSFANIFEDDTSLLFSRTRYASSHCHDTTTAAAMSPLAMRFLGVLVARHSNLIASGACSACSIRQS